MIKILRLIGIKNDLYVKLDYVSPTRIGLVFEGGCELLDLLKLPASRYKVIPLKIPFVYPQGRKPEKMHIGDIDVVVNEICDPDGMSNALKAAESICATLKKPVINEPSLIYNTSRDKIVSILSGINGVYVPKTIAIYPRRREEILEHMNSEFPNRPVLFREAGKHSGKNIDILRGLDDMYKIDKYALDGRKYYLTEFIDYASEDGLYRKYRVFVIDGKFYPRHLIISNHWNIHAVSRQDLMFSDERLRDEEKHFLETFAPDNRFLEIWKRIRLHFFCIDFSYYGGDLLLFEVNACCRFRFIGRDKFAEKFHYPNRYIKAIREALVNLIDNLARGNG